VPLQNGMVELGLAKSLHPSRFSNNPIQGHSSFASLWTADEGIVAKQKFGSYVTEREHSTWFKILNREYSQKDGREELFERERHQEPVAGWHLCDLACADVEG
jgi:hypothetical protein